jgi:hypothetical protein
MRQWFRDLTVSMALLVSVGGCACETGPAVEVGPDVAADAAPDVSIDAPLDAFRPPDVPGCLLPSGYLRCTGDCRFAVCPSGLACHPDVGICVPSDSGCHIRRDPTNDMMSAQPGCGFGGVCWFDGDRVPADEARGSCVPPGVCLLAPPDVPAHRCFWSDGTEVTRDPGSFPCPDWSDLVSPNSTCGNSACLEGCNAAAPACVGRSDDRPYGICMFWEDVCRPGVAADLVFCESSLSLPCVCMVPETDGPYTTETFGFPMVEASCQRYVATFPGSFRCVP